MLKISNYTTKEASRVYGDFAEKVAFNLNIDPASVIGSIAGGYTANRVYNKKKDESIENERNSHRIENNTYSQAENLLRDLKIVFTPINVIYSVNGQVFEIIKTDEMTAHMRNAFQKKDSDYFRNLLVNKVNMEIQLAEQAFAHRLLSAGGYNQQAKTASYTVKQEALTKMAAEDIEEMSKVAKVGLPKTKLTISPTFDSLRPFSQNEFFFNPSEISKVAGIFDLFDTDNTEDVSLGRLHREVNVGFLPDRVVYTWNGQILEQMTLLQMNDEGYKAFREKNKDFFIDFFKKNTVDMVDKFNKKERASIPNSKPKNEETPTFSNFIDDSNELDKDASALEDIVDDIVEEEFPVIERESVDIFQDPDIHPIVYDIVLDERLGDDWTHHELEAILKQLEIDFEIRDGIAENPLNKIMVLHTLASADHAMYQASLTFEKFMRIVNSKDAIFEEFQGNLSFEEIMFGLEVAKAYDGEEVYLEFHDSIAPYISEELMNDGVRFVSTQLYDEDNPAEHDFFKSVNGYLMRKWKERDAHGILDEDEIDRIYTMAVEITEIADDILSNYADQIDHEDPYASTSAIILNNGLAEHIDSQSRNGVMNMVIENVVSHYFSGLFLEYKVNELEYTLDKLREGGVIRGS